MYRIRATIGKEYATLVSGDFCKVFSIRNIHPRDWTKLDEFSYMFANRCRELIRDRLHKKYGTKWRNYEQPKQISISTASAYKRLQLANRKELTQ